MVVKGWDDEQSVFKSESASEALWLACFLHWANDVSFFFFLFLEYPDIPSENQDLIVLWYMVKPQL